MKWSLPGVGSLLVDWYKQRYTDELMKRLLAAADETLQMLLGAKGLLNYECAEGPSPLMRLTEQTGGMSSRSRRDTVFALCAVVDELPAYQQHYTGDWRLNTDFKQYITDDISDAIKIGNGKCQVRTWLAVQGAMRNTASCSQYQTAAAAAKAAAAAAATVAAETAAAAAAAAAAATTKLKAVTAQCEELEERSVCVVCQSDPKQVLLQPCLHLCLCIKCSTSPKIRDCPICRAAIDYKETVHLC
jgi:microcystin-dependent protein